MVDSSGDKIYAQEIELVKVWSKIEYPLSVATEWTCIQNNYDIFDMTFSPQGIMGIQTPTFQEPKIPVVTVTSMGFVGSMLASLFAPLLNGLQAMIGAVGSAFLTIIDGILYGLTGQEGLFSGFLNQIGNIATYFTTMLGQITTTIGNMVTVFTTTMTLFFGSVTTFFTHIWNIVTWVTAPALGIFIFIGDIFSVTIAWLNGASFTNGAGQVFDFTGLASLQFAGVSGGAAIFAMLAIPMVGFYFAYGTLDLLRNGTMNGFTEIPLMLWKLLGFLIAISAIVWQITVGLVKLFIQIVHAIRQAIPKIFGTG